MDIQQIFQDPRIIMLEKEIARRNEHCQYTDEEKHVMKYLLKERCNVLWHLNVYNDETKRLLVDFNDALRKACAELYRRTKAVYQECLHRMDGTGTFEVEGKVFLDYEYPEQHPVQTDRAKQVWDALTCGGYCTLYDDNSTWGLRFSKEEQPETLEEWLGIEDPNDNWNEGLDREWSKGLHLIQPFHDLYNFCYFSLYDLIYVREFNLEVHVEFGDKVILHN